MGIYKAGDYIIIPRIPDDGDEWPSFTNEMEDELGLTLRINTVFTDDTCSVFSKVRPGTTWRVKFDWITPATRSILTTQSSPYYKICNKIKQLDAKWEAKQKQKGTACVSR